MRMTVGLIVTVFLVLVSALGVVWSVHESRKLTNQAQQLVRAQSRLQTEWGQLLLERSTWGGYARVEQKAREQLEMHSPQANEVVVLKSVSWVNEGTKNNGQ